MPRGADSGLNFPPIEQQHARVVESGADGCVIAVKIAQDCGIGFELRREEVAQFGKSSDRVVCVFVGGFVVDDPPAIVAILLRRGAGAEDLSGHARRPERMACRGTGGAFHPSTILYAAAGRAGESGRTRIASVPGIGKGCDLPDRNGIRPRSRSAGEYRAMLSGGFLATGNL